MSILTGWRERSRDRRQDDAPPAMLGQAGHGLYLYDDEADLLDVLVRYVAEGQYHQQRTVVLTTPERLAALTSALAEHGLTDWLEGRDARTCLDAVLVDGAPDRERLESLVSELLAGREAGAVRVYGEMVGLLAEEGRTDVALQLERLWNELVAERPVLRLCAYSRDRVDRYEAVCRAHSHFRL